MDSIETEDIRTVVLLVVDGLGYDMWLQRRHETGFFGRMTEKGLVFPITTVFPSTTAAALTTVYTGSTPQEHGLPEWHVYMKELDMIISTLPFSAMGEGGQDGLLQTTNPKILLADPPIFYNLGNVEVKSVALLSEGIARSAYTRNCTEGGRNHPICESARHGGETEKEDRGSERENVRIRVSGTG